MLKIIKNTFKHSIIYSLGNIGIKIVGLILIPIYTNPEYLTTNAYGAFALLESIMTIITGILPLSMGQSLTRWYWDEDNREYQKKLFFKSFIFLTFIQFIFILVAFPFAGQLSQLIFQSSEYTYVVKLTLLSGVLTVLIQQAMHLAKVQQKSAFFSITNIFRLIVTFVLVLIFVIRKKRGLEGIWEAQLISTVATLFILLPYIIRNMKISIRFPELRSMLKFGFPFTISATAGIILVFTDKYLLNIFDGLEQTAIYSLGYRISNTIKIIVATSISFAIAPIRMKMISNPTSYRFFAKNLTYIAFVMMIFVLLISLFSLEGIKLFTGSTVYWKANNIVPILSMAIYFGILKDFSSESMLILKKTKYMSLFVYLTGILNIILNYLLIPLMDIYGAALSTLVSQLFLWLAIYTHSQRLLYIPYEITKIIKIIVTGCMIMLINLSISDFSLAFRMVSKVALFISFPVILYWLHFYEEIELKTLKTIYNTWKSPNSIKENLTRLINNNKND